MNAIPSSVITELKRNKIILTWDSVHRPGFTYTLSMELKVCDAVLLITRELMETPFTRAGIFLQFHIPAKTLMNITLRQGRLSGVARATLPDKQSHLVINYCIMF